MRKVHKLTGTKDQPPKKLWPKYPCKIAYRWDGYILPEGNLKDVSPMPEEPLFMTWRTAKPFEPWPLELIRRKFYVDLKDVKDWERDLWMPKVMTLLQYICEREIVSVYELAKYFGMPRMYLWSLCRRDVRFRAWLGWCRGQNDIHKGLEAIESKAHGRSSILELIKPHSNGHQKYQPFKFNIDVGWKAKVYARRLSKRQREVEAHEQRQKAKQAIQKPIEYPL